MPEWQYSPNNDVHVPIDQGYFQRSPNKSADATNASGCLTDPDGQFVYLWIHQIESGFQVGGQYAQSANKADWHARNFIQPRFKITGQTANQYEYNRLAEFIRVSQNKSLRFGRDDSQSNTTKLVIYGAESNPTGVGSMPSKKGREPHVLYGHILNIERRATRFVNAPEYSFEFQIAFAYKGLFTQDRTASASLRRLAPWMDIFKNVVTSLQDDPDKDVDNYYGPNLSDDVINRRTGGP